MLSRASGVVHRTKKPRRRRRGKPRWTRLLPAYWRAQRRPPERKSPATGRGLSFGAGHPQGANFDGVTTDPIASRAGRADRLHGGDCPSNEHAKGRKDSPYLGRKPAFTRAQFAAVREMLGNGTASIAQIAKATGVKRPTVYRLKADPAAAEAALAAWGI
jgi:hypothetical protein